MGYLNEDGLATLVGKVKGQVVQLTAAEYRQIPAETKNTDNKIYFVEDDDYAYAIDNEPTLNSENLVKSGGVYNYTSKIGTGALTTTAQTLIPAVNELKAAVDTNTSDIAELNNGLTSIQTLDNFIGYKDRTVSNISISTDNSEANLGNVYTNWGLPSGAYVLGFYVRGWSGAPGTISLASSSDGRSIYVICSKSGTIGTLSIRVWYARF